MRVCKRPVAPGGEGVLRMPVSWGGAWAGLESRLGSAEKCAGKERACRRSWAQAGDAWQREGWHGVRA